MAVSNNLGIPYHPSAGPELDGPAVVQMILDQIGPGSLATQPAIYAQIQANNSEPGYWYSDPNGVKTSLNGLKPAAFNGVFVVYSLPTENEASRRITFTLHHYKVGTATLVYSGGHWVVVKGIQTDVDPLANPAYHVNGFWIHNPWPNDPMPGAPSQDVWIDYSTWTGTYFSSVAYGPPSGGIWRNHYVSVCDPTPLEIGKLKPVQREPRSDGRKLIKPEKALDFLRQEVEQLDLSMDSAFRRAWSLGNPADPYLTQRLDTEDRLHYLFPWRCNGATVAVFHLDARFGLLREAALFTSPARWPNLDRDDLIRRLMDGHLEVVDSSPLRRGRWKSHEVLLRPGTWCLHEALAWLPCWESRSPAFPFFILSVGDRHFYISTLDGSAYQRLRAFGSSGPVARGGA